MLTSLITFKFGVYNRFVWREDDVERFCELIYDKLLNTKRKFNLCSLIKNNWEERRESYLHLIDNFGTANCFKQAIMNDVFDFYDLSGYAIAGENNEIVRMQFDCCFETVRLVIIAYHIRINQIMFITYTHQLLHIFINE